MRIFSTALVLVIALDRGASGLLEPDLEEIGERFALMPKTGWPLA
jgi:hypothetical protein